MKIPKVKQLTINFVFNFNSSDNKTEKILREAVEKIKQVTEIIKSIPIT